LPRDLFHLALIRPLRFSQTPEVLLLTGLPGSGKTTLAKRLAAARNAVRFTLDERMIAAFPHLTIYDDQYGIEVAREKEAIWQEALSMLAGGRSVILDWSLWSRAARAEWSARALAAGYDYQLFYLDLPLETIRRRLAARNALAPRGVHRIALAEFDRFSQTVFEPPAADEELNLIRFTSSGDA